METMGEFQLKEPIFPIGIAAKMVGVSPSTLRMYESEGLLIPYKTMTNMRLYTQDDLEWILNIRSYIKKEKLSVEGIRRILALIPCWKLNDCSNEKREQCVAYVSKNKPCWMVNNGTSACKEIECRACGVYRNAREAFDTKKMLAAYTNY